MTTVYTRRWSRAEYGQMMEQGLFRPDDRLELLDGVNLVDRTLEVHRAPTAAPETAAGWRYAEVRSLGPEDTVSPVAAPGARIPVADLLP